MPILKISARASSEQSFKIHQEALTLLSHGPNEKSLTDIHVVWWDVLIAKEMEASDCHLP